MATSKANLLLQNFRKECDLSQRGYLEEPEIKLPTSTGSWKKQESSRKTSISALLTMPKAFDCVDHNKLWKILKEMGISDHLTCLLRNSRSCDGQGGLACCDSWACKDSDMTERLN